MSFENFVQAQLTEPLADDGTSVTIAATAAPNRLPPETGGSLVLVDSVYKPSVIEIIRYRSRTGMVLEGLERGLEETTALAWPAGSFCYQSLTAGTFTKVEKRLKMMELGIQLL